MSSDGGKNWSEHGNIHLTTDDKYFGWAENNIVEVADGRILMIIRGDRLGGVLYWAESKDGGRTWPEFATKSGIPDPGSNATLYGLGGNSVAILHNPNPSHRSPMALWIGFDAMKSWPYRRVLAPESCDGLSPIPLVEADQAALEVSMPSLANDRTSMTIIDVFGTMFTALFFAIPLYVVNFTEEVLGAEIGISVFCWRLGLSGAGIPTWSFRLVTRRTAAAEAVAGTP